MSDQPHPNIANVLLDIYRLITIFLASEPISRLEVPKSYGSDPLQQFADFERDEITRILLTIAATVRVIDDRESRIFDLVAFECGSLVLDVERSTGPIALTVREACNKILHASEVLFDRIDPTDGASFLRGTILLTGTNRARNWRASVDVVQFSRECASILKLLMLRTQVSTGPI